MTNGVAGLQRRDATIGPCGGGLPRRRVARPRRRPEALPLRFRRKLIDEARGQVVIAAAVERPRGGVGQREQLHGAGHPHVGEAALLFDALLLDRTRVREDPLLHPDHEDGAELETLRVVERHQGDQTALVLDPVLVGDERDRLEELGQRRALRLLPVLAGDADELLQIPIRPRASMVRSAS